MGSLLVLMFVARFAENRGHLQALLPAILFVDTCIGESGLDSNRQSLAPSVSSRRRRAFWLARRSVSQSILCPTSRIRAPWFTLGTETAGPRFECEMQQAIGLVAGASRECLQSSQFRFWSRCSALLGRSKGCCFKSSCSSERRSRRRSWCARLRLGAHGRFRCTATTRPGFAILRTNNRLPL